MIIQWLLFILTLILGFIIGIYSRFQRDDLVQGIQDSKRYLKRSLPHKVGAISAPTQYDIIRKENPKLAEEEEEMRKAFKDLEVEKQ